MFVCKICGNEVKQGQAFCQKCGADVVENYETVCPVCGAKNGAGSRYCAKCGGILSVMRKPVCAVCGAKNLPGAKYCVSCGAPIAIDSETHSDNDMIDALKAKKRLDNMERDRMAAIDREIADKRAKVAEEKEQAMLEVKNYREKCEEDYAHKVKTVEAYKKLIDELGSDDIELLKKVSVSLQDYSKYYADPYSQIDEDDIDTETYVCPACGTINPLTATACINCGRNKARALLLLAKNKIKQSPPVKRKQRIIPPPEEDLKRNNTPTLDEFENELNNPKPEEPKALQKEEDQKKEPPADFSGPSQPYYGYPYPPFGYPYQQYGQPYPPMQGGGYYPVDEQRRQMPPIVQPVAFVPYVTQEQPLMQYSPDIIPEKPSETKPLEAPKTAPVTVSAGGKRDRKNSKI